MYKAELLKKYSLNIGLFGMILLIIGVVVEAGSVFQKILFLIGALILTLVAYLDKQKMLLVLEIIITIGAILAFYSRLSNLTKYSILLGLATIGIGYLIKINYFRVDRFWPIGGLGLVGIAIGLATNALANPVLFNASLGFGSILIAIYSAISFFYLKIKVSLIWLILNIIFAIKPLIVLFS